MKIIVPIKQVPEVAEVKVDQDTGTLIREGVPSILNPFDEIAVEEAIQLRDAHGGEVIVMTMGPPQAKDAIWKARYILLIRNLQVLIHGRQRTPWQNRFRKWVSSI